MGNFGLDSSVESNAKKLDLDSCKFLRFVCVFALFTHLSRAMSLKAFLGRYLAVLR